MQKAGTRMNKPVLKAKKTQTNLSFLLQKLRYPSWPWADNQLESNFTFPKKSDLFLCQLNKTPSLTLVCLFCVAPAISSSLLRCRLQSAGTLINARGRSHAMRVRSFEHFCWSAPSLECSMASVGQANVQRQIIASLLFSGLEVSNHGDCKSSISAQTLRYCHLSALLPPQPPEKNYLA